MTDDKKEKTRNYANLTITIPEKLKGEFKEHCEEIEEKVSVKVRSLLKKCLRAYKTAKKKGLA